MKQNNMLAMILAGGRGSHQDDAGKVPSGKQEEECRPQ